MNLIKKYRKYQIKFKETFYKLLMKVPTIKIKILLNPVWINCMNSQIKLKISLMKQEEWLQIKQKL